MAFDMAAVVKAIGDVVAGETTVAAVYTAAEHGEGGMVGAVNTFPSVLVFPGPTRLYRLTAEIRWAPRGRLVLDTLKFSK